jgi:hypothetical protein
MSHLSSGEYVICTAVQVCVVLARRAAWEIVDVESADAGHGRRCAGLRKIILEGA